MATFLRLLFLSPIGFILACLAAGWTVAFGVYGLRLDIDILAEVIATAMLMTFWSGAFAFAPTLLAIVVSELFGWRSVFVWLALGGLLGAIGYVFPYAGEPQPGDNDYFATFVAAGFVGGFVYWLIAGRLAGRGYASDPGSRAA